EFARSYEESQDEIADSVFMRVIKESLWQELADITDKTQLEWREVFQDLNHHGVYHSGEVVGLVNLVCEKCDHHIAVYTPEVLPRRRKAAHGIFHRLPLEPKVKATLLALAPCGRGAGCVHEAAEQYAGRSASKTANASRTISTIPVVFGLFPVSE